MHSRNLKNIWQEPLLIYEKPPETRPVITNSEKAKDKPLPPEAEKKQFDNLKNKLATEISILFRNDKLDLLTIKNSIKIERNNDKYTIFIKDDDLKKAGANPYTLRILNNHDIGFKDTFGGIIYEGKTFDAISNAGKSLADHNKRFKQTQERLSREKREAEEKSKDTDRAESLLRDLNENPKSIKYPLSEKEIIALDIGETSESINKGAKNLFDIYSRLSDIEFLDQKEENIKALSKAITKLENGRSLKYEDHVRNGKIAVANSLRALKAMDLVSKARKNSPEKFKESRIDGAKIKYEKEGKHGSGEKSFIYIPHLDFVEVSNGKGKILAYINFKNNENGIITEL